MNNIHSILKGLNHVSLDVKSFLDLIGDYNYTEHRPHSEDVESQNDNWVCFEGKDWFLEFVNDEFLYLALRVKGLFPVRLNTKFIVKRPTDEDFDLNSFLLIGNRFIFENISLLPNRFSPILNEFLK